MKLDHCHRASCVQIIDQLRTTNAEQAERINELEGALRESRAVMVNHFGMWRCVSTVKKINELIGE